MRAVRSDSALLRRAFSLRGLALPLVVAAAILDARLGGSSVILGVLDLLAVPAAILAGTRERGWRLAAVVLGAAAGLSVAGQLAASDHYSFFNDLFFFVVVIVGAPSLVGVIVRRRVELIGGLAERARRLNPDARLGGETSAAAGERDRLRHELDAVLTDRLAEIVIQATGAERAMDGDPARSREALVQIETAARSVLDDLRGVLGVLRVGDEDLALRPAASLSQLEDLHETGALTLEVHGERGSLDPAVDATAFRVAREAIRGGDARAHVRVSYQPRTVLVEVTGGRFPADGEDGIEHRIRLFGGRCRQTAELVALELPRRVPW